MSDLITATTVSQGSWPEGVSLNPDDFSRMLAAADIDTIDGVAINAISGVGTAFGSVAADRVIKIAKVSIGGTALHAGVLAWTNPEASSVFVLRCVLDVTTASTGACTVDIGPTATSATTASDTLIDGKSVAGTGTFDSTDDTDNGTNGVAKAQKLASAKWVTFKEASGDATGLVAVAYIFYVVI